MNGSHFTKSKMDEGCVDIPFQSLFIGCDVVSKCKFVRKIFFLRGKWN